MLKWAFLSYEPAKPYMQLCYCAWPWKPYGPKTFKFCFFELFAFACLSTGRPEGFIEQSFVVTGLSVVVSAEKVSEDELFIGNDLLSLSAVLRLF